MIGIASDTVSFLIHFPNRNQDRNIWFPIACPFNEIKDVTLYVCEEESGILVRCEQLRKHWAFNPRVPGASYSKCQ